MDELRLLAWTGLSDGNESCAYEADDKDAKKHPGLTLLVGVPGFRPRPVFHNDSAHNQYGLSPCNAARNNRKVSRPGVASKSWRV